MAISPLPLTVSEEGLFFLSHVKMFNHLMFTCRNDGLKKIKKSWYRITALKYIYCIYGIKLFK